MNERYYRNFIKFQTSNNFTEQHAAVCNGVFVPDPKWNQSHVQKRICTKCKSVAFIRMSGYVMHLEGYIPKAKLGIEPSAPNPHKTTTERCIGCESWTDSATTKDGFCPSCRNSGPVSQRTDYDDFYRDDVDIWQQGQDWEVGSRKKWTPSPPPSNHVEMRHINHIRFMFERGVPEREIRLAVTEMNIRSEVNRVAIFNRAKQLAENHGC